MATRLKRIGAAIGALAFVVLGGFAISQSPTYNYFPVPGITYTPSGGMALGTPTGGVQGPGTLNSPGLFVNGAAVATGGSIPTGANPTGLIGLSTVNGSAITFMRSDGHPALDQSISPMMTGDWTFHPGSGTPVTITAPSGVLGLIVNGSGSGTAVQFNAGASNGGLQIDSTNASGPYEFFSRSGTTFGFIGNGAALGSGLDALTFRAESAGFAFLTAAGAHGAGSISNAGTWTISTPSSGIPLTIDSQGGVTVVNEILPAATTNTLLGWQQGTSAQWFLQDIATTNNVVLSSSAGSTTWTPNGNVTIAAPSSGNTLTVTQQGSGNAVLLNSTGNTVNGAAQFAFDTNGDLFLEGITPNTSVNIGSFASGTSLALISAGSTRGLISSSGNLTFNAPSTGQTLTVAGAANAYTIEASANPGSGVSFGLLVNGGTTSADQALTVVNQANTQTFLRVFGDGGTVMGSPTGGDQGIGTINAQGLFVNGVAVSGAATTGTFTGTLTGMTATVTINCEYTLTGNAVTLTCGSNTGTSNAATMTMTGLPAAIQPAVNVSLPAYSIFENNSVSTPASQAFIIVTSPSTLTFSLCSAFNSCSGSGWTNSGTKGILTPWSISYNLNL